jgi:predicted phage-related endonuclease
MRNREQFLLDRKLGLGGSDIAPIMKLSQWCTPLDVYKDKMNPAAIYEEESEDLKRGARVEKYILQEYSEVNNYALETNLPPFIDPEYPFMRGNIDAKVVGQNVIVEAKSTKCPIAKWEEGIPEYYRTQVAYYAMLTNAERVDVPVLFSNWQYACFTYWRDLEYEAQIRGAVIDFWNNHIVAGIPPEPSTPAELQEVYPKLETAKTIKADSDIREKINIWQEAAIRRRELEKQEEKLKIEIQNFMGDASVLDAGFCKVALKERTATRLDAGRLKEAMPELYREYSNDNTYRILQIIGG